MTQISSPPLPTRAAVAVAPARAHAGAGASSRAGRTFQAAGPYTPSTVLALRAGIVAEWIRRVERAEAAYAQRHRRLGRRPGNGGTRAQAAFEGLLSAVGGLRVAWQLFRIRADADGVPWQQALRHTLPELLSADARRAGGLRQDTPFSYAVAQSAGDIATCFLWRLKRGYCRGPEGRTAPQRQRQAGAAAERSQGSSPVSSRTRSVLPQRGQWTMFGSAW